MPITPFEPKFMKVGVLTAALQELTPRDVRDPDPDRAIEEWLEFARELGARLHPAVGRAAPDGGRRAARGDARSGREHARPAQAVRRGARQARARRAGRERGRDLGHRLLRQHAPRRPGDPRRRSTTSCCACSTPRRCSGVDAVCGFVGRNQQHSDGPEPGRLRGAVRAAPEGGEGARPRRTASSSARCRAGRRATTATTTSRYAPGTWIALHRICEKHGVGDQFRIHYDPSHAILMGQDTRSIFQYLKDAGYDFLIGGFHVKGQVIDAKGVAAWGYGGQTMERGDWKNGKPSPNPADQVNAWKKQVVLCRARAARHGEARSARVPAEPHRRLARSSARRARAAAARRRQHRSSSSSTSTRRRASRTRRG